MRVLVTGAGGQLGAALVPFVAHHDVLATTRAELDVTDRHAVEQVVGRFAPDAVVNCTGLTDVDACERDPDQAYAANALAVRFLAAASQRVGAHLVHISTDYVFDGARRVPYREWDPPAPLSVYGSSKLAGEREAAVGSWAVVRTSWVFGRRGRDFVSWLLDGYPRGAIRGVVADATSIPTYAPDLASVVARIALERRAGLFHVANREPATRFEWAQAALRLTGEDPAGLQPVREAELNRPARRPMYSVLDTSAAAAQGLGPLRPWSAALAEYLGGRQ